MKIKKSNIFSTIILLASCFVMYLIWNDQMEKAMMVLCSLVIIIVMLILTFIVINLIDND